MTKSDLIAALAVKERLTEKMATDTINLIFNGFADTLKKGGRIEVRCFGTVVDRKSVV
jgi:integration host factor subunit beta